MQKNEPQSISTLRLSCGKNRLIGRSGEAQTRGLRIPNAARYQLRYTPIVIKLWSCKWSNLWSNTFLTAFFHFPNRPKYARLKGFRRFSLSCGANTVYAPKCGALSTALHPGLLIFARYRILNSYISNFHVLNEDENVRTFRRAQLRTADPVYSS